MLMAVFNVERLGNAALSGSGAAAYDMTVAQPARGASSIAPCASFRESSGWWRICG